MSLGQQRIISPSPNSASLGKYGEIPISPYTGVPNISIPIYTIKCGSIELPITLNYHASGIKVAEQSSWVGLGWSLNAGGVISRTVYGFDDFGRNSNVNEDYPPLGYYFGQDFPYLNSTKDQVVQVGNNLKDIYAEYLSLTETDNEPDVYSFNFMGYTGRFFFDRKRSTEHDYAEPVLESANNLKIKYYPSYEEGEGQSYGRWEITDGKGYMFFFESYELTSSYGGPILSSLSLGSPYLKSPQPNVVNTWCLDRIEAPNGDFIEFRYSSIKHPFISNFSFNEKYLTSSNEPFHSKNSSSHSISYEIYLSEIIFNNGKLITHTSERNDILNKNQISPSTFCPQKLDSLVVFNNDERVFKCGLNFNYASNRLMLDNIQYIDKFNKSYEYSFEYKNPVLPDFSSNSVDHWGYNNGRGSSNCIPTSTYINTLPTFLPSIGNGSTQLFGTDRNPNPDCITNCMLEKIIYPTGGFTKFQFEPNTYSSFIPYNENNYEIKRAGTYNTNMNDYTYDSFSLNNEQDVEINYGFIDSEIANRAWVNGYCEFNSDLAGTYAQVIKVTDNTETIINSFSTEPNFFDAGTYETYTTSKWNFSNTINLHLTQGNYKIKVFNLSRNNSEVIDNGANSFISAKYIASTTLVNTKNGGGVRVKKIENFDGINLETKTYEYKSDNNLSSGKLLSGVPMYSHNDNISYFINNDPNFPEIPGEGIANFNFYSNNPMLSSSSNYCGHSIGYDKVTEILSNSNKTFKNIYYFMNDFDEKITNSIQKFRFVGYPGFVNFNPSPADIKLFLMMATTQPTLLIGNNSPLNVPVTSPISNGLLVKKEIIGNNNNILKLENYFYSNSYQTKIVGLSMNRPLSNSTDYNLEFYNRKCEWWKLDYETVTEYLGNDAINSTIEYQYNLSNYLVNKKTITSNNLKSFESQTTFPCDIQSSGTYTDMTDNNMIEYPIETREYVDSKLVKSELNTYNIYNNKYLPAEKYFVETNTPLASFNAFDGNRDSHYSLTPQMKFNTYGSCGRINEVIQKDGVSVVYLWSYNNEYPIAEIKNATLAEVSSALSGITPEQLANAAEPDMTKVETLRTALPNAQITTYTYKPLVGITKTTDSRGVTTYYEHDSFYRLKQTYIIENGVKKILQKYDYHYAAQQ